MTGGQANDGGLTVPQIARQVAAEGAKKVVVVTDEPWKYSKREDWPRGLTIHHRDELNTVQTGLAAIPGVTVLIYDQTCAAEKRRRRKRGKFPDPDKRVVINELVCEGCGDCGVKSNCVSVQPLETEWGRKRTIDQSSCNKDFSCVKGFCPSFVTVEGGKLKQGSGVAAEHELAPLPEPTLPVIGRTAVGKTFDIIVTGVGGTGVVTIGGILGMAAHLEGKGVGIIDMAGLAQKGGAVYSHMRIAEHAEDIHAIRIAAGAADLVLGGDIVVAGNRKVLAAVRHGATEMVINTAEFLPGDFTRNADFSLPTERLKRTIVADAGRDKTHFVDASRAAAALFGNTVGANIFLVGYAYQLGAIPLSAASILQAIELNGEAVAMNQAAFQWGRRAAHEPAAVEALIKPAPEASSDARRLSQSLDETIERRVAFLTAYQDAAYAARYRGLVDKARAAEAARAPGKSGLAEAVARYLFKLMAYKDEYEVARLYADGAFAKQVRNELGGERLRFYVHLAPPLAGAHQQGHRRAAQDDVRAVDLPAVPAAGQIQGPARHRLRSVRLFGRAQDRARSSCATTRRCSTRCSPSSRPRTTTSRSGSPPSRRRSAASATSRCATSRPPRPTRPRCSTSSAPARRRCSRPRSSSSRAHGAQPIASRRKP